MGNSKIWIVIFIFCSHLVIFNLPNVEADDLSSTAINIDNLDSINSWICSPDCGTQSVDEYDWYRTTLEPNEIAQVFVDNSGDYSSVTLLVEVYESNDQGLIDFFEVESDNNNSFTYYNNKSTADQFFISITTNDGWYDDGTNYSIFLSIQSDNHWSSATDIEVGSFLDEGIVCISDCPGDIVDGEDWYHFVAESNQSIGIVAEELTWFTYLDFELFTVNSGALSSFEYEYFGGSAGGLQDYSVRAWFNTTEMIDIYVRVFTNQSDDVLYNLSISSGSWVDVIEDEYHWVAFPDLKIGDEIRVQAIRTDVPNDLDILLFNSSEFENYRMEVVNNETTSPSELLAEEDCLVCSISFILSDDKIGLMDANPQTTHDINQPISWSPTLILVADYTDYRRNPPSNSGVDIASVFLSISVLNSIEKTDSYQVHKYESSEWLLVDNGNTSNGTVYPPLGGWSSDSTTLDFEGSSTLYRLIVQDSITGTVTTNSTFEVTNSRPIACIDLDGSLAGTITEYIPVRLDARCSSDYDNDDLVYQWTFDDAPITTSAYFELTLQKGNHTLNVTIHDQLGLSSSEQITVNVSQFPFDGYDSNKQINITNQSSTSIKIDNVLFENTTVAPQWLNFGVIGTEIGVGLNIESRIVQNMEYDLDIVHENGITSITRSSEMMTTETAMKVNLALIIKNIESGNETIYDLPMPMTEKVYNGQPWFPVGLFDRVYYWGDLAVVSSSGPSPSLNDNSNVNISIPALDIMEYISAMANYIPGSQVPLLALGIAVDYNLYLDIDLQFEIENNGTISMILLENESEQIISHTGSSISQSTNETIEYYSYSTIDSSIDIFGSIGLRLRIAQPGWLTTGLGFFYEDPMFLEGIWEYTISESDGPLASSNGMIAELANTSVSITIIPEMENFNSTSNGTGDNDSSINNNSDNSTNDNNTDNSTTNNDLNNTTEDSNGSSNNSNNSTNTQDDIIIPDIEEGIEDSAEDTEISESTVIIITFMIVLMALSLLFIRFLTRNGN